MEPTHSKAIETCTENSEKFTRENDFHAEFHGSWTLWIEKHNEGKCGWDKLQGRWAGCWDHARIINRKQVIKDPWDT